MAIEKDCDRVNMRSFWQVPIFNGNVLKIPHNAINITEEMNKSGCWKSLEENSSAASVNTASATSAAAAAAADKK